MPPSLDPDADSTRDRLLAAAADVVVEQGWGAVTTRGVAERAGVRPGLVHYHFTSVDELRRTAVVAALEQEIERAIGPLSELTPLQILTAAERLTADLDGSPLSLLLFEALPPAARDPAMQAELARVLVWFRDLLADRIRACHPRPAAPPDVLAELIAATLDGLALHVLALPELDVHAHLAPLTALLGPQRD